MNRSHKLLSIMALCLSPILSQAVSCSKLPFTVQCPSVSCDVNVVHISQADVGPAGYLISAPGVYCLTEDINWTPSTSGVFGIPIAAITIGIPTGPDGAPQGDVVLDLNGYYLSQAPGNTQIYTAGIKVNGNFNNLIIKNGTVQNFSTVGIYIDPVVNLTLENLTVANIGFGGALLANFDTYVAGIAISGINNFNSSGIIKIDNVHVYDVSPAFPAPVAGYGLFITSAFGVNISNSSFSRNTAYLGQVGGINITTSTAQVRLFNVEANENFGLTAAYGMLFQYLGDVECVNCNACANSINGVVSTQLNNNIPYIADGFSFNSCIGYTLINCRSDQNIANVSSTGVAPIQKAAGFEAYRSSDGNFEGCVANSNFAPGFTGGSAYGFHIASDNTKLTNCFAANNAGWDTAWGFAAELFFNDIFPLFGFEPFQRNIVIDQSVAEYNIVLSGTGAIFGGGGIKLQDVQNSVVSNSVSSNNSIDGILLAESTACNTKNNLIQSNKLISNTVWGIQDITANHDNVYIDNRAINNPGTAGVTNFDPGVRASGGDTTNGFVIPWAVPGIAPLVSDVDKISNLDITSSCPPIIPG